MSLRSVSSALLCVSCVIFSINAQPVLAQNKVIIGVGEITDNVGSANPENFQTMLETLLVQTNKFDVIERARLDEILNERGLSMVGIADGQQDIGGIQGVDYLIYGAFTKLGRSQKQSNLAIIGINKNDKDYEAAVDLRIVDVANGKMVLADTVEVASESGSSFTIAGLQGYGAIGTSGSEGDPLSDVQRLAAIELAGVITTAISPIKVAAVQSDGTVILNYGDSVLADEEFLKIYRLGEGFVDPDTGELLGAEEIEVGALQVVDPLDKYSKTKVVLGDSPQVGDIARKLNEDDAKAVEKAAKKEARKRR